MAPIEDMSLDALLDDLAHGFPTGYLEDFALPELQGGDEDVNDMSVVDYGGLASATQCLALARPAGVELGKRKWAGKPTGQLPPTATRSCEECGLVPADVHCTACVKELCAYCDFQTHPATTTVSARHDRRAITQLGAGWANGAKLKGGKAKGAQTAPKPFVGLDQTILEFFKTDEFASAASKAEALGSYTGTSPDALMPLGLPFLDATEEEALRTEQAVAPPAARPPPLAPVGAARPANYAVRSKRIGSPRPRPSAPYVFSLAPSAEGFEMTLQQFAAWRSAQQVALVRWRKKKIDQRLNPTVRYRSRQKIADGRPRVKGRFIKTAALVTAN
jgi:hypothetical protein